MNTKTEHTQTAETMKTKILSANASGGIASPRLRSASSKGESAHPASQTLRRASTPQNLTQRRSLAFRELGNETAGLKHALSDLTRTFDRVEKQRNELLGLVRAFNITYPDSAYRDKADAAIKKAEAQ